MNFKLFAVFLLKLLDCKVETIYLYHLIVRMQLVAIFNHYYREPLSDLRSFI